MGKNKFLLRLALNYVKQHVFSYVREVTDAANRAYIDTAISEAEAAIEAVPVTVWVSLNEEESRAELKQIFQERDAKLAKATFTAVVKILDEKHDLSLILNEYEEFVFKLALDFIEIMTDDNIQNAEQLVFMLQSKVAAILTISVSRLSEMIENSKTLTDRQKQFARQTLPIFKTMIETI